MTSYYPQENSINQPSSPPCLSREAVFSPTPEPNQVAKTLSNEIELDLGTFDLPSIHNHTQSFNTSNPILNQINHSDYSTEMFENSSNLSKEPFENSEFPLDISEEIDAELDDEFLEKIYKDIDKDDDEWLTKPNQLNSNLKDVDPLDWLNSRHEDSPVNNQSTRRQAQKKALNGDDGQVSSLPLLHHDPDVGDMGDFGGFASDDNDLFFDGGIVDTSKTNDYLLFGVTEEDLKETNYDAFSPQGWNAEDEYTIDELLAPIPDLPPLQSEMMAPPDPEIAAYLNQFRKQIKSNDNSREINPASLTTNSNDNSTMKNTSYIQQPSPRSNSHNRSISIELNSSAQSYATPPPSSATSLSRKPLSKINIPQTTNTRKITKSNIQPPPNFKSMLPVPIPGYRLYTRRCISPTEPEYESRIPSISNGLFKPKIHFSYYQSPDQSNYSNDYSISSYSRGD